MSETARFAAELKKLVAGFDPALLTGDVAAAEVGFFAEIERLAGCAKVLAAGRVEETRMWHGQGKKSAADWLAEKSGSSVGEAAGDLRTAKKIKRLRRTLDEMKKGKLSTAQASAVADGADADPAAEDDLLDTASKGTLQNLKSASQKAKAAANDDKWRHQRIHARRSVRTRVDDEGAFHLHLYGTASAGAHVMALLRPYQEHHFRLQHTDGIRDSFDARTYDAFMAMLGLDPHGHTLPTEGAPEATAPTNPTGQAASRHPEAAPTGTSRASGTAADRLDSRRPGPSPTGTTSPPSCEARARVPAVQDTPDPAPPPALFSSHSPDPPAAQQSPASSPPSHPPGRPPGDRRPPGSDPPGRAPPDSSPPAPLPAARRRPPIGGNNVKVIVRIDHTALVRGHANAGETVEIAGLGHVPVASVKALMDDAFLAAVVTKGRDVHTVAHLGRAPNAHQRTALEATNIACSAVDCNRTINIEIDHAAPWADTHHTRTSDLDPLCTYHHQLKTHHGWTLEAGTGPRPMHPPAA